MASKLSEPHRPYCLCSPSFTRAMSHTNTSDMPSLLPHLYWPLAVQSGQPLSYHLACCSIPNNSNLGQPHSLSQLEQNYM